MESVSSSSQANEVNELRRDSVRTSSKGLRGEGVKPRRGSGRRRGMEGVKGALLRSVSVDLAKLRRVFKVKYFRFMDEIVTGGVGHLGG